MRAFLARADVERYLQRQDVEPRPLRKYALMKRIMTVGACAVLVSGLSGTAAQGQAPASGSIAPTGPPTGDVVRVDAGGACVIDLVQRYAIEGTLTGSLSVDYRIFVDGPCGSPAGTFDEHWIARGTFEGMLEGSSAKANLWYRADVEAGGKVDGTMSFAGDFSGDLSVAGNFADGRLTYAGALQPS